MKEPKILYIGPIKDFSGYAHAARDYIKALDLSGCNLVTRALRYDNGDYEFSPREAELFNKDTSDVDIVIQHTTPNETEKLPGVFNVNYFAWETDRVPPEWVEQLNKMDLVLVPCDENIKVSRKSGVTVPMVKIPHTFDYHKYEIPTTPYSLGGGLDKSFKFLSICQYSKKKAVDVLLKAYLSEFTPADNTVLILKTYITPKDNQEHKKHLIGIVEAMKGLLRLKEYPRILLVHQVMSDSDIERLYAAADTYVLPSRGEGWSITHFDAMGWGVPPIAVNWAGPTEFITKDCGWLVDYHMSPVLDMPHPHEFMYTAKDSWAEPHVNHLRQCMRQAYVESKNEDAWQKRKAACRSRARDFDYSLIGPTMKSAILEHYRKWRLVNASN